ncbi:hypothetical protein [Pseudomonas sp. KNUC1026]|uniref:hypothetical protein n=1 Tax=Pseudomonas sp. KNUC1026 TaxID=2893890 RepID=UPI001F259B94|nr:hypothetical protein [Pseudomonas sp. KNUC1026]UFH51161.1 hypothetical protein LN139_09050 [Pseudomonas sp. KNUC1026]
MASANATNTPVISRLDATCNWTPSGSQREKISSSLPGFPTIDPIDLLGHTCAFSKVTVSGPSQPFWARVNAVQFCICEAGFFVCQMTLQSTDTAANTFEASTLTLAAAGTFSFLFAH